MRDQEKQEQPYDGQEGTRGRSLQGILRRAAALGLAACLLAGTQGCVNQMDKYELRDLGIEAMRAGDYEGAKQRFEEALTASDGQVSGLQYDILKYRGECELRLKQYGEARKTYEILEQLDQTAENQTVYTEVLGELAGLDSLTEGLSDMEQGDYETALEKFSQLADLHSGLVGRAAWFNQAACLEYLQRYEEAREAFAQYLEAYPEDAAAQKELDFLNTR